MALIIPNTWVSGPQASATFNTYIRDQHRQLLGHSSNPKPFAIVNSSAANTLTTGVFTTLVFDAVVIDRVGFFDGTSHFVVPSGWAGWYSIKANVDIDVPAGNKELRIVINDAEEGIASQNTYGVLPAPVRLNCAGDAWLDVGDTIAAIVFQDHPVDIVANGGTKTRMSAMWQATDG